MTETVTIDEDLEKHIKELWSKWDNPPSEVLLNRLKFYIKTYSEMSDEDYPVGVKMLGFPELVIEAEKDLLFRMRELCECLGVPELFENVVGDDYEKS